MSEKPVEIVDPDSVELSDADKARIRAKVVKAIAADRKKALERQLEAQIEEELRGKEGMLTGDPEEDRIVNVMIDVGENTDRIVVNGKAYFHGVSYELPIHMARSLQEIMFRSQMHEHGITDKPLSSFYQKPRHTVVSRRGAKNAPVRPDGHAVV